MKPTGLGVTWLPLHGTSIGTDRLTLGQQLLPGQSLVSKSGKFELNFGQEGQRLTLWTLDPGARDKWLWISEPLYDKSKENTWKSCLGGQAIMQTDGNFAQIDQKGNTCWETQTANKGAAYVVLQDDGNLVVYTGQNHALWGAGTQGGHRSGAFVHDSVVTSIGNAISSIPVVGDVTHIVGEAAAAPFNLAKSLATGERLDHALLGQLKDQIKIVKDAAPYAQTVVSLVPGIGTGVAAAVGMGAALAEGKSIDEAAKAAIRGAIPGGAIATTAFDTAMKIASGENVGKAALETARAALPDGAAQKAFDVGLAVATGEKIQNALANGLASLAPGQLQPILAAGQQALSTVPGLSDAFKQIPQGAAQEGFTLASGLLSHSGLNEKSLTAVRSKLPADVMQGFDAALKTQEKHIPWLANVTSAPASGATPVRPVLTAPPTPVQRPVLQAPAAKVSAYAPYPHKGTLSGLGAPHGGGHGGHGGGGHPGPSHEVHPFARWNGGRGGPGWWWGVPWSPEVVSTGCQSWGAPLADIPPAMRTAARIALNTSRGQPTAVRGPDNVLYLFSIENGVTTARPCAS